MNGDRAVRTTARLPLPADPERLVEERWAYCPIGSAKGRIPWSGDLLLPRRRFDCYLERLWKFAHRTPAPAR